MSWVLLVTTILFLGAVALRRPRWTAVLLSVAVALEIASQFYPQVGNMEDGVSLITLARLVSAAVIAAGVCVLIRHMRGHNMPTVYFRLRMIFVSPLMLVILGFWLYGIAGIMYSADTQMTIMESLRWGMLMAVFVAAAYMLEKEDIPRVLSAVHIMGLLLAPLAFAEKLTGQLIWQSERLMVEYTLRVNATFVDPNIYARYLVLAIAANLVLQRLCTTRRGRGLYWLGLAVLLPQLALTGSRGGVLTLAVVLVLALICLPRRKELAVLMGAVTAGGAALVFAQPKLWERVMEISNFLFTHEESPRRYLIEGAAAIFRDHAVFGTGLGSFPTVLQEQYGNIITVEGGPVRSHTTVLTIAAEQGVIGLLFLAVLLGLVTYLMIRLYTRNSPLTHAFRKPNLYIPGVGCFLWVAAIFISSQAEGRFFEDPMFWLASAMLMVLHRERMMTF